MRVLLILLLLQAAAACASSAKYRTETSYNASLNLPVSYIATDAPWIVSQRTNSLATTTNVSPRLLAAIRNSLHKVIEADRWPAGDPKYALNAGIAWANGYECRSYDSYHLVKRADPAAWIGEFGSMETGDNRPTKPRRGCRRVVNNIGFYQPDLSQYSSSSLKNAATILGFECMDDDTVRCLYHGGTLRTRMSTYADRSKNLDFSLVCISMTLELGSSGIKSIHRRIWTKEDFGADQARALVALERNDCAQSIDVT